MSANQNKGAAGGPQTQRFANAPFPQFPGADGYVPSPQGAYVSNQGNQGGNQGPGLRGIPTAVPPNQAPTPPNADIKVQQMSQQPSMNQQMYVQPTVRNPPYYQQRMTPPTSQAPRMPANHNNRQTLYPSGPYVMHSSQMYMPQYFPSNRPPHMMQTSVPVFMPSQTPYPYNSSQPQQSSVPLYNMLLQRPGTIPPPQSAVTVNPAAMTVPVVPTNNSQHQSFQKPPIRRRPKAIPIIDPDSGADRLQEMFEDNSSHPPSGESSARQTPQPTSYNHTKEVQATFAKQVLQAINTDIEPTRLEDNDHHHHHHHHKEHQEQPTEQNYQQPQAPSMEHIVHTSNFNAMAKEFVLPTSNNNNNNTAKETPIVSAMCDAVEVTIHKLHKDRESPVKGRKKEQQQQQQQHQVQQQQQPQVQHQQQQQVQQHQQQQVQQHQQQQVQQHQQQQPKLHIEVKEDKELPGKEENKLQQQQKEVEIKEIKQPKDNGSTNSQPPVILSAASKEGDKKSIKKETKPEPRQEYESQVQQVADINSNSKTKQGAQRVQQKQNVQQNNGQSVKTTVTPVPQPQPPKPTNKTHKRNEINQKGASKEGTDMDAFNDNIVPPKTELNSNSITDIINANSASTIINNEINSKSNDNATIKQEPVKSFKQKVDVTDIVKDRPKTIVKSFNNEVHDEPDRGVVVQNDQIVQAKNEVNAKSEVKVESKLPYQDGQWTPTNQSGMKIYQKEFLLALRNSPSSKVKPDNIPDMILADGRGQLSDGRASMGGRTDFTNPPFTNYGGKSGSQRGSVISKRPSAGKMVTGVKTKSTKLSISVKEDVKLHEVENAWRPTRLNKSEEKSEEVKKTEELYKKVRGVLNKLTPQKFDTLLSQIKGLKIDTPDRLRGVIDLVFDKAVDEPNFSVAYANMCKELALMQVPTENSTEDKPEYVNFRKLLITRCQNEFEKQSIDESIRNAKVKEIEECTDPEKKKDLQFDLEEYDRRLRMKSVGNIRFIGELFKQNMLTINIMLRCLNNLLDNKDEESLECLCKLLTTIGKEMESKNVVLAPIFAQMKNIADKKDSSKISSRIRFMLQDVIDLRNSKWVPRRQDLNPKTIDQIQKEADHEQMNIQLMNSVPMTPRKDDRIGLNNTQDRKGRSGRNVDNEGWTITKNNRQFSVQSDKLKNKAPTMEEPLGSSAMWGSWSKGAGSNAKVGLQQATPSTLNMYAALENIDPEKRNIGGRSKEPYSSKGPSLERNYKYEGRNSRSESQHRSNDSSGSSSQRSTPAPAPLIVEGRTANKITLAAQNTPEMTEEQLNRRIENSLDEYIGGNCTLDEYYLEITSCIPPNYYSNMIMNSYVRVLEKSQPERFKTGELFAKLMQQGRINIEDYCNGLEEILMQADDLQIDIPKIWDYLADILVDVICTETLSLARLRKCISSHILPKDTVKLLTPLFKLIINREGAGFLQSLWHKSNLQLSDFIEPSLVDAFVKDNQFEFLLSDEPPETGNSLTYEDIHDKLRKFFASNAKFDDIINWITMHLGPRVEDVRFVRTLATAIFEDCINDNKKVLTDRLIHHNNLLLKYVDNNPKFELECLYALQAFIHKLEHPQGALLTIVEQLYELGTASQESFIAWEQSTDAAEQEGKGVALKQLTAFFTQLKENDEESSEDDN